MSTYHCHSLSFIVIHCLCDGFPSHVPAKLQRCRFGFDILLFLCKGWTFQVLQATYFCQLPASVQIGNDWDPTCLNSNMLFWIARICTWNGSTWAIFCGNSWQFQDLIHVAPLNCKWYKTNPVLFQKKIIDLLLEFNPRTKTSCWWRFWKILGSVMSAKETPLLSANGSPSSRVVKQVWKMWILR